MNGLQADASCDDDAVIAKINAEADAACAAMMNADITYVCPPYPEPDCTLPGAHLKLPTQMFSDYEDPNGTDCGDCDAGHGDTQNAAGSLAPTLAVATASLLLSP